MARDRRLRVAIVGAGKVGSVLGRILVERGDRIVCIVSRGLKSARAAGKYLRCKNCSTELSAIPDDTDAVLITTPHGAVEDVARGLSRLDRLKFRTLFVCHASGMLTADVLEPLRLRGATVFSFHPLQTFPRDFSPADIVDSARGIWYGVDGPPAGIRAAKRLAGRLGGRVIVIPPEMRAYYHAACVLASNHLTAMLSVLEAMFRTMKTGEKKFYPVFKPILMATLDNIESTSPASALSGPVARGGTETVARHFEALARFSPELIPYFARLSLETVRLALVKGSIDAPRARELTDLVRSFMDSSSQVIH